MEKMKNKIQYMSKNLDPESLGKIIEKYGDKIEAIYPLSPGQAWMLEVTKRFSDVFFLQNVVKFEAPPLPGTGEELLLNLVKKRQNLRTAFVFRGMKTPFQVVLKDRKPEVTLIHRPNRTIEELSDEIDAFCEADRTRGFDPEEDSLLRITVFAAKNNGRAFIVSRPHLIDDGESYALLGKDLILDGLLKGKLCTGNSKKAAYQDYVRWLEGRDCEKDLSYWKELLKEGEMTALPNRLSSGKKMDMRTLVHSFSKEKTKDIQALPGRYNATLNSILHTLWGILLSGYTGKKDIVFGTISSGRSMEVAEINQISGCFINAFPVRVEVKEDEFFGALARRVQKQILISREYAYLSPGELGRKLGNEEGFFDHLLNFHNFQGASIMDVIRKKSPGYTFLGDETYDNLSTGFCLYFDTIEERFTCTFCYDANQFSEEWICILERSFVRMIEQILSDGDQSLLCGRLWILETVTDRLLALKESEHTALICGKESISYSQLVSDAKQIARCLLEQGIQKGDRVLLAVKNSIHIVRAMYGILLAGGVYVAADTKWPAERMHLILEEAEVSLQVTDEMILEYLGTDCQEIPLPVIKGEDEGAIYYTSGSTGTPKGTALHHRVFLAHGNPARILQEYYERDSFLIFPAFASVVSAIMVFMLNAYEKTLIIATPEEMGSVDRLVECMTRNRVQSVGGTPSFLLRALLNPSFANVIRQQVTNIWAGGEQLKKSDADRLYASMKNGTLSIGYGLSEAFMISSLSYEPEKELFLDRIPIGVELHVVDENQLPVSNGETGELLIGGVCGQYGHYLDPELTRKKYVDHPFYGRCFCTGDAARVDEKGRIILSGRIDRMIKLHGLRIEPAEVETAMESFRGIRRAAVAMKKEQLCGYYTGEKEVEERSLRQFLSEQLPYFMIPSRIIYMKTLPVSGNGKLDFKALPEPETDAGSDSAPANEREELLCRVFGEVLSTEKMPGAEDSFFSFGGDSIHALKVASLLEKEGYSMELKDLFAAPTARLLAPLLRVRAKAAEQEEKVPEVSEEIRSAISEIIDWDEVEKVYPASAVMENYLENNSNTWPQVYCFEISSDIPSEQIKTAVQEVSRNHTAIRSLLLPTGNGHFCQVVLKTPRSQFFRTDLSALSEGEGLSQKQKSYLSTLIRMEYSPMSDLGKKTLFRIGHIRISKEKALLYIGSSHLTIEGASVDRLFRELTGQEQARPDTQEINRHMARLFCSDRTEATAYWENLLKGCKTYTELPKGADKKGSGKRETVFSSCGRTFYEKTRDFCRTHQVTLSALFGYSLGKSLMKILSLDEVCFSVAGNGRSASEMDIPGMFVLFFPLRLTKEDTIFTCQNQLLTSSDHAWVWADPAYSVMEGSPLRLRSTHSSDLAEEGQMHLFTEILEPKQVREIMDGTFVSDRDTVMIYAETANQLSWSLLFDSGIYDAEIIRSLSAEWIRQLRTCIGTGEGKERKINE